MGNGEWGMKNGGRVPTLLILHSTFCIPPWILRDSVPAATAGTIARRQVHRDAVGTEPGLRLGAPVPGAVVAVVEMLLVGVLHCRHVHPLMTQAEAVNAGRE